MRLSLIAAALASAIALCEGSSSKMVIGYLPNWLYANYPVENIPYNKYTHLNYAFAILNNEDNLPSFTDDWAVESSLPKIIDMAHANNTKVLLSVGGWTGSKRFSPMVASPESRKKFIDWNLDFIQKYNTDGVDLDWEYPGKQAAGCNEFADNDAENYLQLLKEMRVALDTKFPDQRKEISMAVHVKPFIKAGVPMNDVKEYVPYFDHINLMTYDINGAWASTTGPNAPLRFEEGKGAPFSFVESIRDWKSAGVPADKITAGLAFYGRTMKANQDMTVERSQFQSSEVGAPKGDSDDAHWQDPFCSLDVGGLSGIWKWTNLRKEGLLQDVDTAGEGWQRNWDEVSQTPWLFNPSTKHFITYDDPQSLKIKVEHALCEDLAGVMVWDIHQDNGELIEAVGRIHEPAPASCENLNTVQKNNLPDEVIEVDPETDIVDGQIDDLGNWVEPPAPSVDNIRADVKEEDFDFGEFIGNAAGDLLSNVVGGIFGPHDDDKTESHKASPTSTWSTKGDQSCSEEGQQKCVHSGKSTGWLTCNYGSWLYRDCADGTVCHDSHDSIYCDAPNSDLKAASFVDGLNNTLLVNSTLNNTTASASAELYDLQADRIIPSHIAEHSAPHASTLPVLPSVSEEDDSAVNELNIDNQLGQNQAKLAVEHPLGDAQVM